MFWFLAAVFTMCLYWLARDIIDEMGSIKFNREQIARAKEDLQWDLKTGR